MSDTVYSRALEILHERGWHQGGYVGDDGSVCITNALALAADSIAEYLASCGAIEEGADVLSLPAWNDKPERTFEDIALALKQAHYEAGGG